MEREVRKSKAKVILHMILDEVPLSQSEQVQVLYAIERGLRFSDYVERLEGR